MRYYVIWPDGQKFGPADVDTLTQWASEGRITENTELESVESGSRLSAGSVPGLVFVQRQSEPQVLDPQVLPTEASPTNYAPYSYPQGSGGPYPRGLDQKSSGQEDINRGWIFTALGFFCCCVLAAVGVWSGYEAKKKGHPGANALIIASWIVLGLQIIGTLFWIGTSMFTTGMP